MRIATWEVLATWRLPCICTYLLSIAVPYPLSDSVDPLVQLAWDLLIAMEVHLGLTVSRQNLKCVGPAGESDGVNQ